MEGRGQGEHESPTSPSPTHFYITCPASILPYTPLLSMEATTPGLCDNQRFIEIIHATNNDQIGEIPAQPFCG